MDPTPWLKKEFYTNNKKTNNYSQKEEKEHKNQ